MDKILIVNLGGIGDIVLSVPALTALRRRYPQARIDLLTATKNLGIVGRWGVIDAEYGIDMAFGGGMVLRAMFAAARTLLGLRTQKYDAFVNMRTLYSAKGAKKMQMLARIVAAKKTYGRNTEGRGAFFDVRIDEPRVGELHESQYDRQTVALLGAHDFGSFSFPIPPQADRAAAAFCGEHGIGSVPFVLWHVGGMPSRRYPADAVVSAIEALPHGVRVVITAGAHERSFAAAVVSRTSRAIDASGIFGVDALAAMMQRARAVVSNDTGPMHIAAVLERPLLALLGPGDFTRFDPRVVDPSAAVLRGDVRCAPCEFATCDRMLCMKAISPADVAAALRRMLRDA
jgi:ADP-heptose:LPS heptosyltransferase